MKYSYYTVMKNKTPLLIIPGWNTIAFQRNVYAKFWREFIIWCWRTRILYIWEILHYTIRNRVRWIRDLWLNLWDDFEVTQVFMPSRHFADYNDWVERFEQHIDSQDQDIILVGYSLWALFLVKYLSENPSVHSKIKHVFLVGTFYNIIWGRWLPSNFQFEENQLDVLSKLPITFYHWALDRVVDPVHFGSYKNYMKDIPNKKFVFFDDRWHMDKNYLGYNFIKLLQKYYNYPASNDFPELIEDIKKI